MFDIKRRLSVFLVFSLLLTSSSFSYASSLNDMEDSVSVNDVSLTTFSDAVEINTASDNSEEILTSASLNESGDVTLSSVSDNVNISSNESISLNDLISSNKVTVSDSDVAYSGVEWKPSLLNDGTYGLVIKQKWFLGQGVTTSDKKLAKENKKGFVSVKGKEGNVEVSYAGKTYKCIITKPSFSEKKINLQVGESKTVAINGGSSASGNLASLGYKISWMTSNQDVAQVCEGTIVATGAGSAYIIAVIGGKQIKMRVKVTDKPATTYLMDIPVGKSMKIKVPMGQYSKKTWTYEGTLIEIPQRSQKVKSLSSGRADVSGNDGHNLRVYGNTPEVDTSYGIAGFSSKSGKTKGGKYTVKMIPGDRLYVHFPNSHEMPVWKSNKPYIAAMSEYGVIIAESKGTAKLKCKNSKKTVQINVVVGDERSFDPDSFDSLNYEKTLIDNINGNSVKNVYITKNGDYEISDSDPNSWAHVLFDARGGNPNDFQSVKKGSKLNIPVQPVKENDVFLGWYYNGFMYDFNSAVYENMVIDADWLYDNESDDKDNGEKFLLILDPNGGRLPNMTEGTVLGIRYISEGTVDLTGNDPVWPNHTFLGWYYQNGSKWEETDILTNDTMLIAYWSDSNGNVIGAMGTYVLFNDTHGYIYVEDLNVNKTVNAPDVKWTGHIFNGWQYADGSFYDPTDTFTKTVVLTAVWDRTDINSSIAVKFKPENGDEAFVVNVNYGDTVPVPDEPEFKGHAFDAWYAGNLKYDFTNPVTRSLTLTAHWTEPCYVSFNTLVKNLKIPTQSIVRGRSAKEPGFYETYGGNPDKVFNEWDKDSDKYNFSSAVNDSFELQADWIEADAYIIPGEQFNIKATAVCGGTTLRDDIQKFLFYDKGIPDKKYFKDANCISLSYSNTPVYIWREGDTLYWWSEDLHPYLNDDCSNMFTGFTHLEIINGLYPMRTDLVKNYYNMFGNTSVNRNSYISLSWNIINRPFTDDEKGMFDIIYRLNGGSVDKPNPKTYNPNQTFTLNNPHRTGYIFNGWTEAKNGSSVPPSTEYTVEPYTTGILDFTANWTPIIYSISYDLIDGYGSIKGETVNYTIEDQDFLIVTPKNSDTYSFKGWTWENLETGEKQDKITKTVTIYRGTYGNLKLTAHWDTAYYNVIYHNNDESSKYRAYYVSENRTRYLAGDEFTLNNPVRTGYDFLGWKKTNSNDPAVPVYTVISGTAEDLEFDAVWKPHVYSISYKNITGYGTLNNETLTYTIEDPDFSIVKPENSDLYEFTGYNYTISPRSTEDRIPATKRTVPEKNVTVKRGTCGDIVFSANWGVTVYGIVLHNRDENSIYKAVYKKPNRDSYTSDDEFTLVNPVRTGYDFLGWKRTSLNEEPTLAYKVPKGTTGNLEFDAVWKPHVYSISYDNITPYGTLTGETVSYTVEDPDFTLKNASDSSLYHFSGWNYEIIPGPADTVEEQTVSTPSRDILIRRGSVGDISLHGNWELITYPIIYRLNNGTSRHKASLSTDRVNYTAKEEFTLKKPVRPGYKFIGWEMYLSDAHTAPNPDFTVHTGTTGTLIFDAVWELEVYSVSYNDVGTGSIPSEYGTVASPPVSYTIEDTPVRILDAVGNGDYYFVGWTGSNGSVYEKDLVIPFGDTGNKTYTANWSKEIFPIIYHLGDSGSSYKASLTDPKNSYQLGETFTLKEPVRNGYEFLGWKKTGDPDSEKRQPYTLPSTTSGKLEFDAVWEPVIYTIGYTNVSTTYGAMDSRVTSYTIEDTPVNIPNAAGNGQWNFTGWKTGSETAYSKNRVIAKGTHQNISYQAGWTPAYASGDYYKLTIKFTDANTEASAAQKVIAISYHTHDGEAGTSGYIADKTVYRNDITNNTELYVLKNTTVRLRAPATGKYPYYMKTWTGSGAAFTGTGQVTPVVGEEFSFDMLKSGTGSATATTVTLTTKKNPAFFG